MRITSLVSISLFTLLNFGPNASADGAAPTVAESALHEAVDQYISGEMENNAYQGYRSLVVRDSKLVQIQGYGKASLELNAPSTPATLYGLGSISKQFTATAIMLLVEAGKITLDDHLTSHFDWVPKEWTPITVRHLLTHTSGIPTEQWKDGIIEFDRFEHKQEEVVRTAFGPLSSTPGEKFAYSNLGYRLLGMLIEKVTGQAYWDFLTEHIFRPIAMDATRSSDPKTIILNRARGYGISGDKYQNREPVTESSAFAQGALISSVLDLVKWDAALNSEALLKKPSLDQMWTPVRLNDGTAYPYGFGWYLRLVPGHRTVAHGGGLPGFATFIWRFMDGELTVIVLANCETADTGRIALDVAGFYVPALVSPEIRKQL